MSDNSDIPYIEPNEEITPTLLSMAGTLIVPSREELESDPRLAAAFGEIIRQGDRQGDEDIKNGNYEIVDIDKL